jgi:hypothetical protein
MMHFLPRPITYFSLLILTFVLFSCNNKNKEQISLVEELSQFNKDVKHWGNFTYNSLEMKVPKAFLNDSEVKNHKSYGRKVFENDAIEMVINSERRTLDTLIVIDYIEDELLNYADYEVISEEKVFKLGNRRATIRSIVSDDYGYKMTVFLFTLEDESMNYFVSWSGDSDVMQYLYDDFKRMFYSIKLK